MTKTARTVTLIDRTAASIARGEGTIAEQWDRLTAADRALFDNYCDFLHAALFGLERTAA